MKYVKAAAVLPESLLAEIQKYVQGEMLYIPKPQEAHQKWGTKSGGRKLLEERNADIRCAFQNGRSIADLAQDYFLSAETIKRIVYKKS
ncbi:CD3324 family protein [Ectobacillus ponti]|uniref:CD3324 family protein n=1 Tax=Ectobacillus ponti TaxID=2961894 RepID=A0AA41X340_9BACI|nr:CD3324 family protein [Ectobacillus ponti]MCP8967727.1 CD3324 family protein [Ectobacillus ponti]